MKIFHELYVAENHLKVGFKIIVRHIIMVSVKRNFPEIIAYDCLNGRKETEKYMYSGIRQINNF